MLQKVHKGDSAQLAGRAELCCSSIKALGPKAALARVPGSAVLFSFLMGESSTEAELPQLLCGELLSSCSRGGLHTKTERGDMR